MSPARHIYRAYSSVVPHKGSLRLQRVETEGTTHRAQC